LFSFEIGIWSANSRVDPIDDVAPRQADPIVCFVGIETSERLKGDRVKELVLTVVKDLPTGPG